MIPTSHRHAARLKVIDPKLSLNTVIPQQQKDVRVYGHLGKNFEIQNLEKAIR